jgi:hypothetical protein
MKAITVHWLTSSASYGLDDVSERHRSQLKKDQAAARLSFRVTEREKALMVAE